MSLFYYFWKIWLCVDDSLKRTPKEFPIEIPARNILKGNKDIAEKLITEDIGISYSNLTYIIDQYDRVVRNMICEGYSVKTNNLTFTPQLSGEWSNECIEFNPEVHKCSVECTLSPEMNRAINSIGVKVQGLKDESRYISSITNAESEETDTIRCNEKIIIEGNGIQAIAKDGSTHNCILLINKNNEIFDLGNNISVNEPNRIVLCTPRNLERGKYHLFIHTFFTTQKGPRPPYYCSIEFQKVLIVK